MSQAVAPPPAASYAELILQELTDASPLVQQEVLDFLRFLKTRPALTPMPLMVPEGDPPIHLLSEAALAEDWLSPEDEEAWKDL